MEFTLKNYVLGILKGSSMFVLAIVIVYLLYKNPFTREIIEGISRRLNNE